jgi:hypothetical protein
MTDLKIRVFKTGEPEPETTITIPGGVLKVAYRLIPKEAAAALRERGIDVDEIIALSANPKIRGTIVEVEEHRKKQKVIVSLE